MATVQEILGRKGRSVVSIVADDVFGDVKQLKAVTR